MCTDPLVMPTREIFMDGRISYSNQQGESHPSENDNTPKTRKPYTIVKQRERWTDEEHNKFLEAIKLYGRSWRRIEDHIGSKTSVQIRSHAQKFFSKVAKESESSNITMKAVDIPPPRPKRKPSHPYPRKFGSSSSKGGTTSKKLEKSSSPNLVIPNIEDESPRSILSASVSNNVGYSTSIAQTCGTSSDPSTCSSNQVSLESIQQEIGSQSQQRPAEEARETAAPSASDTLTFEGKSDVDTEVVSQGTSFQLFGKTVLVADSSNTSTSVTQNEMTHQRSPPSQNDQEGSPKNFSDTTSKESSNRWSYEVPSMFYYMSSQQELIGASQVPLNPMSWWGCFGSPTFQLGQYPNMGLQQVSSNTEVQEVSGIMESTNSLKSTKSTNESQLKGFVPYKRCSSHRTVDINEERESQRVRLCL